MSIIIRRKVRSSQKEKRDPLTRKTVTIYLINFRFNYVQGLPFSINSVMSWIGNRRTYFFKNEQYWRLLDDSLRLENGYPRMITPVWMKCTTV
mgnify:FL=1